MTLAKKEETATGENVAAEVARLAERLDILDNRLDNIDSIVSAVAERVMQQPITFTITCSKCGQRLEVALIGKEKPTK
jgi:hypothetical protein